MAVLRAALLSCLALALAGCFDAPRAQCALSCADSACPDGYECTAAGLCRLAGTAETCAAAAPPDADVGDDASTDRRDAGGEPDGDVEIPALVGEGLVVRYFLDEAGGGTGPTHAIDSATDPLDLELHYGGDAASYTEDGADNRALLFRPAGTNARASAPVAGTKIRDMLHGSEVATIEVVVRVTDADPQFSRISHIGQENEPGQLSLSTSSPTNLAFSLQSLGLTRLIWSEGIDLTQRRVVHVVLDMTRADGEHVSLYIDGAPHGEPFPLPANTTVEIADTEATYLVLGNREIGGRSFRGSLHYSAVYASALSAPQIATNAARLLADDDR